jgi:hypothetical protein
MSYSFMFPLEHASLLISRVADISFKYNSSNLSAIGYFLFHSFLCLFLFIKTGNLDYYKYHNDPSNELRDSSAESVIERQRRSLPTVASTNSSHNSLTIGNTSHSVNSTGECSRLDLFVDFEQIGWSSWIIAPKGYSAYYCKGHCNFPLGQSQRPTNHATVQSIVHELNLAPDVGKPCCVPTSLLNVPLLFYDDNENVVLRMYEDMVADSCGCQ